MVQKKKEMAIETTNVDVLNVNKKKHKTMLVGMISLGCDKNRVDAEIMVTYLRDDGYKFTTDASNADNIIKC